MFKTLIDRRGKTYGRLHVLRRGPDKMAAPRLRFVSGGATSRTSLKTWDRDRPAPQSIASITISGIFLGTAVYFPGNCRWSDAKTQRNNRRNNRRDQWQSPLRAWILSGYPSWQECSRGHTGRLNIDIPIHSRSPQSSQPAHRYLRGAESLSSDLLWGLAGHPVRRRALHRSR
jgi:hypothetical protein